MLKKLLRSMSVLAIILVLTPACAKQDDRAEPQASGKPVVETISQAKDATGNDMSIMDQPVNFSTPEDVDKSIEAVRQSAGEAAARELNNALQYILYYDLSVGNNKEKMYKKLNGRTPNEIIAKMKR